MKQARRLLVLLLSLTLILPMLTSAAVAEEGYTPTDSYVLNYDGAYDGAVWQYFSPYWPAFKYDGTSDYTQSISFSLYNTVNGTVIPTYCTDLHTGLNSGSKFRRINLEDSTYAANAAGVLRSIVNKGFPSVTVEALGQAAGVTGLTVGEAVAATQAAIWQTAHGSIVEFTDFCRTIDTQWTPGVTAHYDECNAEIVNGYAAAENESLIESHISAVFGYLISLPATSPNGIAVSNSSFIEWSESPTVDANEDGTYKVTVNAKTFIGSGADVRLTAYFAADRTYYNYANLSNGNNDTTITIDNVPAELAYSEVCLAIDGTQTVSDVFLFDAVGERDSSQSLIGKDSSKLPVHAEVVVQPERKINIHKTSDGRPLEGISFDFYKVADLDKYLSGETDLPAAGDYNYSRIYQPDYTIITDANGEGSFSLSKNDMPDGVYLVVEKDHDAIKEPIDPFYVILPATNASGTGYVYTVEVYPKNEVKAEIDITKDVLELNNDLGNVDAYAPHTWIISATIPSDIATAKQYKISDTLDNRLDFLNGVVVKVESLDGTERVTLVNGTDYTLNVTDNDSLAEGKPSDSFTITLEGAGKVKVSNAVESKSDMIRIYFTAQINANGKPGKKIPNQAVINYTNSVNVAFKEESDIPMVYTGAVEINKIDGADGKALAGAEFELYRAATEAEKADATIEKVMLEGLDTPMVKVSFSPSAAFVDADNKVTIATSDADGKVYFYGLADGEYYAVETKAPAGYNLLQNPIKLLVGITEKTGDESTETAAEGEAVAHPINIYPVENRAGAVLPETGGMGTTLLYVGGSLLLLMAFVSLVAKRKAC